MAIKRWMLPDGMEETLPPTSWQLEDLRRKLLDHYRQCGYELIFPPLVEHLDALLTGAGSDLEQQTFKFTDPASGRLLGLRADMTPQAARIAARRYSDAETVRLCYLGTVLRTSPDNQGGPRSPRQVGCELFGRPELEADLEVLSLMLKTLELAGVGPVHLDLGHVGIYRALSARLGLDADDEAVLFEILQRKSHPDLAEFAANSRLNGVSEALSALMDLNGDVGVLERARAVLATAGEGVVEALSTLERVADELQRSFPEVVIHVDLAELRGLRYHTGLVFAAFVPGSGREIARGGRYDGVGSEFGRPLPATGFSADMNELLKLGS
ncbi:MULTISPECIES: ATP phosphoribosyltransferase regulatory subunit [Hydrocarboniphaga]|jgi:ATP phosphoribosyltransferase regulatory subunit|uniref:ATP phosphoribosyltransferase regulatory subunit n=1 Tax=Hydrocarboniphaga effusa AP103 TaxID=1172194 RepID=I8T3E1_9GAMM|nr:MULTISPECIES: ATP phosphoribosyltransferase regulatory subunit [Hydrocarboniphaga]EIT68228.1 histidyl-tRNA synthetase 2 [Hydrocarboniphaga effusa AP103]MDZ4079593.1 ATP phosphoribosyltransferase regulatory subunit [Hydrocarboniphaga sp.]